MNTKEVPKRNMIRVIFVKVNKTPEVKMVRDTLRDFQLLVGGSIERIDFHRNISGSSIYVNEDGISMNLPLNILWNHHYLLGDIFISKSDNEGDEIGLTEEEAQEAILLLSTHLRCHPY